MPHGDDRRFDIPFSVPFVHRLRVTQEVAGADFAELLDVLEGDDTRPAKVLLVAESPIAQSTSRLQRIESQLAEADKVDLVCALHLG